MSMGPEPSTNWEDATKQELDEAMEQLRQIELDGMSAFHKRLQRDQHHKDQRGHAQRNRYF